MNLEIGMTNEMEKIVTRDELADRIGSGGLKVYSTPSMIAFIEKTCERCLNTKLEDGDTSVGIKVDIRHLKATLEGAKVRSKCIIKKVDGNKVFFEVEVYDENEKIGDGEHIRYIVNADKFMANIS
ncbi:MAG: thioesterase family protein [Fusobacteriota bacterium]